MKSKATLKQIAKELGVSVSTVSKALNDSPEISEPTKLRVQEYAKLKKYKPNVIGLNLKNRSTKTIGVILPNILNSFFAKVFTGIEKVADEKGYKVITCISNESLEKEINALEMLSNGTIDGFILSVSQEAQKLQQFNHFKSIINEGTPIVMFDRIAEEVNCDKVVVDDLDSAIDATNHLIKTGCKKIALFSTIDNLSVGKLRAKGYYKALEDAGIKVDQKLIILTETDESFDEAVAGFFDKNKVDAVFALDEHASVMAMKNGIKKGLKIPEELSIIGFADGVWSRRMTPSLSTVSQHGPEIGEVATQMLIDKLESKEEIYPHRTNVIKTELRQRESTRKL
ncbi:LacI family DNA-binding transcriptional regulator [Flavobacterium sp. SUN046]|uniref:LacI family DNA-binding transcriptional regulator n=1 Tax=Flavobacterium sp. SUN046 TaxID=3002440 RepID=UPI002DBD7974|nr:LacI family DNA-binding transcriptional regulator [Flavobacterium sp. SUN046]MEC4050235.1 LacI family DNA-binding transcriptional regulator [Flavobacterium sp. SUN046]